MDYSIDFGNFFLRGYLPLIQGFCHAYPWSCSLCEGRTSVCMGIISKKPCGFLIMFTTSFTSLSVLLVFPLLITFVVMHLFYSISSNIDEILSINPSASMFAFGDFNVHYKDWLIYSGIVFLSQMTLFRRLTLLLRSLTVTLTALLIWIYLFLLILVFILQMLSLHWKILIMLLSQFPLTFHQTQ